MRNFKIGNLFKCLSLIGILIMSGCSKDDSIKPLQDPDIPSFNANLKSGSTAIMVETFTLFTETWSSIQSNASAWGSAGITMAWLPPCSYSADTYGYLPTQWYNYNNSRGSSTQLASCISACKSAGMTPIADIVLNHRNGNATAGADFVNPAFANNAAAVVKNDECACGTGANDSGTGLAVGRDLDHTNTNVQALCKAYVASMMSLGFGGGRYDMVLGYGATYAAMYKTSGFNVGEYWVSDRNSINSWINTSGMSAFDFPTFNALTSAINNNNYTALAGLPGLIGINAGKAVTFVSNHDTPGPGLLGYVYILTHPGIPCINVSDWYSWSSQIKTLISIRKAQGIGQTSSVAIQSATSSVYAAIIDGKVAMKIGSGSWSPTGSWTLATSGTNYAVWTGSGSSSSSSSSSSSGGSNVTITLRMLKDVGQGNAIFYSGDNATLTNWGTGAQATWTTGNYWTYTLTVASGTTINFKARLGTYGGSGNTWESGANHVITNPVNGTTYTVTFQGGF